MTNPSTTHSTLQPTLTVTQAARAGRCATTTIHRLIAKKKIAANQAYKGAHYNITSTREEIAAVTAALPRKTGYHHTTKRNGTKPETVRVTMTQPKPLGRLAELAAFLTLPQEVRTALFVLADQCDLNDLLTLVELTALPHAK